MKDNIKFIFTILSVGLWLILFYKTPLTMRGFDLIGHNDFYGLMASFCNDLPMCLRVGTGFLEEIIQYFYKTVFLLTGENFNSDRMVTVSNFVTSFICLAGAIQLLFQRRVLWACILGATCFVLTPFFIPRVGLVQYDYGVLLFWGIVVNYFLPEGNINFYKLLIPAVIGSMIIENNGIAYSVALFLYMILRTPGKQIFFINLNKPIVIIVCAVSTILIVFITIFIRNHGVSWEVPNGNFEKVWTIYGSKNSLVPLLKRMLHISTLPLSGILIILLGYRYKCSVPFRRLYSIIQKDSLMMWNFSCLLGFSSTLLVGLFASGYNDEWTRQLLPLSYLASLFLINAVNIITESKERILETRTNLVS